MAAISINLLPQELENTKKEKQKQLRAIQLSIAILVVVIGIAAFVLTLRVSQNLSLSDLKKQDKSLTDQITQTDNQKKEGLLRSLKDRISAISQIDKKQTAGSFAYSLILKVTPQDIQYSSLLLDNKATLVLTGQTQNLISLEELFNNLVDTNVSEGKITAANIDNLSKAQDGSYKFSLTVTLIGAPEKKKG